jgi:hypothetical protein
MRIPEVYATLSFPQPAISFLSKFHKLPFVSAARRRDADNYKQCNTSDSCTRSAIGCMQNRQVRTVAGIGPDSYRVAEERYTPQS